MNSYFDDIPVEILILMFQYMDFDTRKTCKLVCSFWFEILMTNFEFKDDRNLNLANCCFNNNTAPVSIFAKSKYKYDTSTISELEITKKENINDEFWEKIGTIRLKDMPLIFKTILSRSKYYNNHY